MTPTKIGSPVEDSAVIGTVTVPPPGFGHSTIARTRPPWMTKIVTGPLLTSTTRSGSVAANIADFPPGVRTTALIATLQRPGRACAWAGVDCSSRPPSKAEAPLGVKRYSPATTNDDHAATGYLPAISRC